ncbi:relaxosome component [Escherichia coli O111:H11 str. CFSAN001630]|nr:relaxosome component [Escherichia coli O111:H11 str. CFSAN001630]
MKKKTNKNVHVTFRLTEEEYAPFDRAIKELNISKSEFFRLLTIGKINTYASDKRNIPEYKRCLSQLSLGRKQHKSNSAPIKFRSFKRYYIRIAL